MSFFSWIKINIYKFLIFNGALHPLVMIVFVSSCGVQRQTEAPEGVSVSEESELELQSNAEREENFSAWVENQLRESQWIHNTFNSQVVGKAANFITIPAGEMIWEDSQTRQFQTITLKKSLEFQSTEFTQLQFTIAMYYNPSVRRKAYHCLGKNQHMILYSQEMCRDHPVEHAAVSEVFALIDQLNKMQTEYWYRLPTRQEWIYAALGGPSNNAFFQKIVENNSNLQAYAWCGPEVMKRVDQYNDQLKNLPSKTVWEFKVMSKTFPVGLKKANPLGLFDFFGNAQELVTTEDHSYATIGHVTSGIIGEHDSCLFSLFSRSYPVLETTAAVSEIRRGENGFRLVREKR